MGTGCDDLSKKRPFHTGVYMLPSEQIGSGHQGSMLRKSQFHLGNGYRFTKDPHGPTFHLQPGISRGAPPQSTPTAKTDPFWNGVSAVPLK